MEFRILGTLEAVVDGRPLDLGGPVQRRVLAALLLCPNLAVPISRLVEVGWDGAPPETAERQVRNRVAALRSILTRHGALIDTVDSGYRIRVEPGALDSVAFDDLVAQRRYGAALALWRGRPFEGLGPALARDAAVWQDKWLGVVEEHAELSAPELSDLVRAYPLRERLVGRLMSVLAAAGRRDDAVAVYDELAARLADRLGIDPSPELRALHGRVQTGTPEPAGPTPRQLPPDVAGFTGRAGDLARLDLLLSDVQTLPAVVISAIDGTAGVGKTALAVHWGHRVRDKFPDGQLYVNLRGFSQMAPVRPIDALGGFLRALGVSPERVPVAEDAAAGLYRELLAERRVLVVLDNAVDADQVAPLLPGPGSTGCLAVVTSRSALAGLPARQLTLEVLDHDEAVALLSRLLGAERVAAEPAAVADLARLCAYLPLALRIAAANLVDQPGIAPYVAQLRDGNRLAALAVDGDPAAAVRGAFALSYAGLGDAARRMFRLLGLAPGPDLDGYTAASLAAIEPATAAGLLGQLAAAHLIDEHVPGRFAFHDLLKLYARELADREADRDAATGRLFDHYVHAAATSDAVLRPGRVALPIDPPAAGVVAVPMPDRAAATAWAEAEYRVVVAVVQQAYEEGADLRALQLNSMAEFHLDHGGYWSELVATSRAALAAAERSGNLMGQGSAHSSLGNAVDRLGDVDTGLRHFALAVESYERAGDRTHVMFALRNLAGTMAYRGDPRGALPIAERAYDLAVEVGPAHRVGRARSLLAEIRAAVGDYERALADSQAALELLGDAPPNDVMVDVWLAMGEIQDCLGRHGEAAASFHRALELARTGGSRLIIANVQEHLGDNLHVTGQVDAARDSWRASLAALEGLGAAEAGRVRAKLVAS